MLGGKGLLEPIQKRFLEFFSQVPDEEQFYLTGGTALSEFYLGHRQSYDLDLFTSQEALILPVSYQIENLASDFGLGLRVIRRFSSYVELLATQGDQQVKIDLALDSPFRLAPPLFSTLGIMVNDFQDVKVDKLLAYFGRAEPRDAVDLYFLLKTEALDPWLEQAAQKDAGFDLYWLAVALNRASAFPDEIERWPVKMILEADAIEIKRKLQELGDELMGKLTTKP